MAFPTRWARPRLPRLLPSAALALTAMLTAAGCSSTPASAASQGGRRGDGPPAITAAQARQAFDSYIAITARANQTSDGTLALSVVTGVQQAVVATELKEASFAHGKPSLAPYTYRDPTYYLPEQVSYPRFFVASATQGMSGGGQGPTSATELAGPGMAPDGGTALLLFEQQRAGSPWLLASVSVLPAGVSMPRMAAGPGGAIPQVSLSAANLLTSPNVTGPLQAAVVDDGPASAAIRAVAPGPLTTGMYASARDRVLGLRPPRGDVYQWELEGSNLTKFALRTADGGALVFYAMYLNTTVSVPGYLNGANPIQPGPPIHYPLDLDPWLSPAGAAAVPRVNVEEQQILSFAAIDPPAGKARIQVIAIGGTLKYATAS